MRRGQASGKKEENLAKLLKALLCGTFLGISLSVDFRVSALNPSEQTLSGYFHSFGSASMVVPLFLAVLLYAAREKWVNHSRRMNCCLGIAGGMFGIANALGQQMYYVDHLPNSLLSWALMWMYAFSGAMVFFAGGTILAASVPLLFREGRMESTKNDARRFRLIAFCIILLGWLPWIISYYPCSADWDAYKPITQYLGMNPKTNHHPWFYCTTVGFFYSLGVSAGNKNLGMFLYVAIRAVIMALIYSGLAALIRRRGYRPFVQWAVILFFAVVPVWGAYAKHAFKDTLCSALFCWFVMETIETVRCLREGGGDLRTFALYSLSALLISLHRNNCVYVAAAVTVLLMIAACIKVRGRKAKAIGCLVLSLGIVLYGGYRVYISKVEHVENASVKEALSIPFQQTARSVRDHADRLTEADREGLGSVFDIEQLGRRYDPLISDPVKDLAVLTPENSGLYLKTWLSMMFRFPASYVEAALAQSYGYYAFTPDQALHAGNWNCGMTIFEWVKDPRFDDEFTCDYIDGLEPARNLLSKWADLWHQLPLLGLTDMKAIYTWLVVLAGVLMIRRKRWMETIPAAAILLMVLTCCASPVNDCFRYFAPAAAATPTMLLLAGNGKGHVHSAKAG